MNRVFKRIFSVTVCICLACSCTAQTQQYKPIFGIRGGMTLAPTDWDGNLKVFPTVGLSADFRISQLPFYIETGAYYANIYI